MSVTAPERGYTAEDIARAHAEQQANIRNTVIALVISLWLSLRTRDVITEWFRRVAGLIEAAVIMGQEMMAAEAQEYVETSMASQRKPVRVPELDPTAFAGQTSEGGDLEALLLSVPIQAQAMIDSGATRVSAMASGEALLRTIVFTELTDAGREADQVALAVAEPVIEDDTPTRPTPRGPEPVILTPRERRELTEQLRRQKLGWVRMLQLPSCSRCAILAGRWYAFNKGFQRHPNCDCRHIPAMEADGVDVTTSPRAYFDSLSEPDQNRYFGKAVAQAIRDGADVEQTVNAVTRPGATYAVGDRRYTREGTTRRGFFRTSEGGRARERRPTPQQIYREANGDRDEARRLLRKFGYIVQ